MACNPITSPPDLLNSLNIEEDPVSNQFYFQEKSFYQEEVDKFKVNMSYIPNSVANLQYAPQVTSHSQLQQHPQVPPPSYQQQQLQQIAPQQQHPAPPQTHVTMLKRKMTLDLNNAKRARSNLFSTGQTPGTADLLTPTDLQKLQLPTPELEKLIQSTGNSVLQTPTSVFFPKNVTEEQELYAKGFEHALKQLHDQSNTTSSSFSQDHDDNSSTASSYNSGKPTLHDFSNVIVKEEPQTVPDDDDDSQDSSSAGDETSGAESISRGSKISPIDMESQEKIKLERKRQRNRLAASKCRRKKLEKISKLEDKVKQLKGENNELGNVLVKLRESVQLLKSQVMEHVQAGCAIVVNMGGSGGNFS